MTKNALGGIEQEKLNAMLDQLAAKDATFSMALDLVGYPPERRRPPGFDTLLKVIIGQQLSVKVAARIYDRVADLMDKAPSPEKVNKQSDDAFRAAGLSRQKILYSRSLANAIINNSLPLDSLATLSDDEAIRTLTKVKGLGLWSAQMYLLSCLGREDIWPVDDLGVQEGISRMIGQKERVSPKALKAVGQHWQPFRSAATLMAWHYYSNAPV